jgi:O-antigen ligase
MFFISVSANLFINGGRTGQATYVIIIFLTMLMGLKQKLRAMIISSILLISIFFIANNYSPNFHNRYNQAKTGIVNMIQNSNYNSSFARRVAMWITGTDIFSDNIFIGSGIGNEMNQASQYAIKNNLKPQWVAYSDYHNVFITIAVQQGVFGLILLLMIFYGLLRLKFKQQEYQLLNYAFIVTFIMWSCGGMTIHNMNPMVFFALWTGILNSLSQSKKIKTS